MNTFIYNQKLDIGSALPTYKMKPRGVRSRSKTLDLPSPTPSLTHHTSHGQREGFEALYMGRLLLPCIVRM